MLVRHGHDTSFILMDNLAQLQGIPNILAVPIDIIFNEVGEVNEGIFFSKRLIINYKGIWKVRSCSLLNLCSLKYPLYQYTPEEITNWSWVEFVGVEMIFDKSSTTRILTETEPFPKELILKQFTKVGG